MAGEEFLGYYSDVHAHLDTDIMPANRRGELCLNCHQEHKNHHGWSCNLEGEGMDFDDLAWDNRYVTVSMRVSRKLPLKGKYAYLYPNPYNPPVKQPKLDMSDWRAWARVEVGHCACNIPQHQCKYHGGARV